MKSILLYIGLCFLPYCMYGQIKLNANKVVKNDTINLKGVVYDYYGKPVSNIPIGFASGSFHPPGFPVVTLTDKDGNFELNGANVNDKLRIIDGRYINTIFANKGSRFVVIYLPAPQTINPINNTIQINAVRIHPKIIAEFSIDTAKNIIFDGNSDDVEYPNPIIGVSKFFEYIKDNLHYPQKAINHNIDGTVEIGFAVKKDGSLTDIIVLKGIGYGCDEQVIQLIKNAGKWRPGICAGKYFLVQQSVSVKFSLTDK
jgi:TonB family protein